MSIAIPWITAGTKDAPWRLLRIPADAVRDVCKGSKTRVELVLQDCFPGELLQLRQRFEDALLQHAGDDLADAELCTHTRIAALPSERRRGWVWGGRCS